MVLQKMSVKVLQNLSKTAKNLSITALSECGLASV